MRKHSPSRLWLSAVGDGLEALESRLLLSTGGLAPLGGSAVGPADAVRVVSLAGNPKANKTGPLAKVNSALASVFGEFQAHSARADGRAFAPRNFLVQVSDGSVVIDAVASGDADALLADLEALGLEGGSSFGRSVFGRLPLDALDDVGGLASLQCVSPAYRPITNGGLVTSQGDAAMQADEARDTFGVDGTGVKIGVLSDSFDTSGNGSYATDVASGDLPAGVEVLEDYSNLLYGTMDEGRGLAQLIHDVAPGADLAFHTAFATPDVFANGIVDLAMAGADIIVDDILYFAEPMFQDGVLAQIVDGVVNQHDVAYFSAAGNQARESYESPFANSGEALWVGQEFRGMLHDFGGGDYRQRVTIPYDSGITVSLQWDQPFFSVSGGDGSLNDMDVYLITTDNVIVASSTQDNTIGGEPGSGDPVEVLQFANDVLAQLLYGTTEEFDLLITRYSGPEPGLMKYVWFPAVAYGASFDEYMTDSSTTYGHANAAGAEAVGAAFYRNTPEFGQDPPLLESYSSAGGTPILFDTGGNRLGTPQVREKPEIVAPDGTNNTFFPYPDYDTDNDGFPNFYGTSAAAPHAAAVAALMREANPDLTPAEIYSALESTAIDMDAPGFDFNSGYGLVDAYAAVEAVTGEPGTLTLVIAADSIAENAGSPATTATATRTNADISSELVVTLTSSDTSEATVPATATILAGQASATFNIDAVDDAVVDGTKTVMITSSAIGFTDGSDTVDVTDDDVAALTSVIDEDWMSENGGTAQGTVSRNTPTASDLVVTLGSSDTSEATVPSLVTIVAGQASATFPITAVDDAVVDGTQTVTITATAGGFADGTDTIDVTDDDALSLTLSIAAASISEGDGAAATTGTVTRNDADLSSPLTVNLASSDTSEATVPTTVIIAATEASAVFDIDAADDAVVDGTQTVTVTASASGYVSGTDTVEVTDDDQEAPVEDVALSDILVRGTVGGDYTDTHASDSIREAITERESGGKPANRHSLLEHKWTFDVTGGSTVTFNVEAHHTANAEGDDFAFAYSTDDVDYADMVTVTKTADDDTYQTFALPSTISGTVYVRVKDTDQTPSHKVLDTVYVDHMFIRSAAADVTDIAAGSVSLTPGTIAPQDSLNIDFTYDVIGKDTGGAYGIGLWLSADPTLDGGDSLLAPVEAGQTTVGSHVLATSRTIDTTEGTWYIIAQADSADSVNEADEANNLASAPFLVSDQPPPTVHVGDLDGTTQAKGKSGKWEAFATVAVHDQGHIGVANATVSGDWSGAATGSVSGVTGSDGTVTLASGSISGSGSVTFIVTSATDTLEYEPAANHDPDGDSDGTNITIDGPSGSARKSSADSGAGTLPMLAPADTGAAWQPGHVATAGSAGGLSAGRMSVGLPDGLGQGQDSTPTGPTAGSGGLKQTPGFELAAAPTDALTAEAFNYVFANPLADMLLGQESLD